MMFLPVLLLVAATATAIEESVGDQVIQACDSRLIAVMRQACEDRNYDFSKYTPELNEIYLKEHPHHDEYRSFDTSFQMREKRSLSIVEACCDKSCFAKELFTYCNDE